MNGLDSCRPPYDGRPPTPLAEITGQGLQTLRWSRYEIESYLVHPAALERFVEVVTGSGPDGSSVCALRDYLMANFPPAVITDPLGDHAFLRNTKARTDLIPPALAAAGIYELSYTQYHEIALIMCPEEIHPEVTEKLNLILRAFNLD